uniref:(California timema) hypothetical protein n=1 Tax=Timema californicum TaxID=61474 RepID=A0A7R9JHF0_TIMCA|nr:unnamed protein product [Timema californicum]
MGAHIVAYVGQNVSGIARITALDPTENGFETHPKIVRLDADDAVLVEAIHTAITPAMPGYAGGSNIPVGDVDFYLNGGMIQPGCHPGNISVQSSADFLKIPDRIVRNVTGCSHFRAVDVYIEAVTNTSCLFWGRKRGTDIERYK